MPHPLTDAPRAVAVRSHLFAGETASRLHERVSRLRDDGERGAQTAEYAMLGGVGAAACGALIALLRSGTVLERIVQTVVETALSVITSWF